MPATHALHLQHLDPRHLQPVLLFRHTGMRRAISKRY
jgi:hypothetical protein